jgi:hypothetical protein
MDTTQSNKPPEKEIARNEPCPCGSGKKYKRCHGVAAAPKLSAPAQSPDLGAGGGMPQLPEGFNNEMMMQMAQMFQRLPKGQLQKLQSIMQRAMSGKDVTREAQDFEKTLPVEFQSMLQGMAGMPGMGAMQPDIETAAAPDLLSNTPKLSKPELSEEEARKIVEQAAASGKLSKDEADALLAGKSDEATAEKAGGGIGRFFGFGKK